MRPRGMPGRWVKILPWYYTQRRTPSRAREQTEALAYENAAGNHCPSCGWRHPCHDVGCHHHPQGQCSCGEANHATQESGPLIDRP